MPTKQNLPHLVNLQRRGRHPVRNTQIREILIGGVGGYPSLIRYARTAVSWNKAARSEA